MAKRKVKMLINLGTDHQKQYGLPDLAENEVASVTEDQANILVNVLKCAKDYDASEEKEHAAEVREADAAAVMPEVAKEIADAQARKDAEKALKDKK
jgi:hypothetical protein